MRSKTLVNTYISSKKKKKYRQLPTGRRNLLNVWTIVDAENTENTPNYKIQDSVTPKNLVCANFKFSRSYKLLMLLQSLERCSSYLHSSRLQLYSGMNTIVHLGCSLRLTFHHCYCSTISRDLEEKSSSGYKVQKQAIVLNLMLNEEARTKENYYGMRISAAQKFKQLRLWKAMAKLKAKIKFCGDSFYCKDGQELQTISPKGAIEMNLSQWDWITHKKCHPHSNFN